MDNVDTVIIASLMVTDSYVTGSGVTTRKCSISLRNTTGRESLAVRLRLDSGQQTAKEQNGETPTRKFFKTFKVGFNIAVE